MKSKGYVRFLNRIAQFNADLEVIDIIVKSFNMMKSNTHLFKNLDPNKHKELAKRKTTPHNRKLVLTHLRQTVYSSYLKDMYEEVTEYLKYIIKNYASYPDRNVGRLVGEHKFNCPANDILVLSSYEEIVEMVTNNIFQQLENERSTIKLLEKINNKLALGIGNDKLKIALPFLLVRHYLVHSDGKIPQDILDQHPEIKVDKNRFVDLTYTFIKEAKNNITEFIGLLDEEIYNKGYLPKREYNPNALK